MYFRLSGDPDSLPGPFCPGNKVGGDEKRELRASPRNFLHLFSERTVFRASEGVTCSLNNFTFPNSIVP